MNACKVKEERRLQKAESFRNTAEVLKKTRAGVAWQAVGCARGAYENTLDYALKQVTRMARELMGANGILISNKVARFLGDVEALYSYEGTKQINSLVVGRVITGMSAFT